MQINMKPNYIVSPNYKTYNSTIRWDKPTQSFQGKAKDFYFINTSYTASRNIIQASVSPGYLLDRYI